MDEDATSTGTNDGIRPDDSQPDDSQPDDSRPDGQTAERGPSGSWGGGHHEQGGEGGYGGGSSGFDDPPEQGLTEATPTGWGSGSDLDDPAYRDPAGLSGTEGSATDAVAGTEMTDQEIEEQPRGA